MFKLDLYIILPAVTLVLVGLTMITSASLHVAESYNLPVWYFAVRQTVYFVFGLLISLFLSRFDILELRQWSARLLLLVVFFLFLILIPGVGHKVNGSVRWLNLGFFTVQVSEFLKLIIIFYVADLLLRNHSRLKTSFKPHLSLLIVWLTIACLLLKEPDFGSLVVILLSTGIMWFLVGCRLRYILLATLFGAFGICGMIWFAPYRMQRLTTFFHPWQHAFDSGYQLTQSLIAFGRGGIWGSGLGTGLQKQFYLPEAHTDFLFAVICEELGFFGGVAVLLLFFILISRCLLIAKKACNLDAYFHGLICYGIAFWFTVQCAINLSVNMGLLPTKGLTLPLVSYGGSSLMISILAVTVILKIKYELDTRSRLYLQSVTNWGR